MFDDLRRAFKEAVDNFREELGRDQVPGTVDRLLKEMIDETSAAKANLRSLEEELAKTRRQVEVETGEVETCRRRERMARGIGDDETADVAAEYAERHLKRQQVLEEKAVALEKEVELRTGEVAEMIEKVKEAKAKRDALTAQTGRTGAREALRDSGDLFEDFDRMAARIDDEDREGRAAESFASEFDELTVDPYAPPREPEIDVDERLEELKRRMGKSD